MYEASLGKKKAFILIALLCGIALFLNGYKSPQLRLLEQAEKSIHLKKGELVERSSQDARIVLGKPKYAQIRLEYKSVGINSTENVFEELTDIFEYNNWKEDEDNIVPNAYIAFLEQNGIRVKASVLKTTDSENVEVFLEEQ